MAQKLHMGTLLTDPATKVLLCCGAGGVGKTTTAAAMGLYAAEHGRKVVVMTIDPARRLAQSLGMTELTNTPPPRPTLARTVLRRLKIWTPLVVLLAVVFVVVQSVRPLPSPTLETTAASSYAFAGTALPQTMPWPAEGQSVAEVEGIGKNPDYTDPVYQWPTDDASPSGLAVVGDTIFIAGLGGQRLWTVWSTAGKAPVTAKAFFVGDLGRLRDVVGRGDAIWLLANNTDGRGDPRAGDDKLIQVPLQPAEAVRQPG